MCIFLIVKYIQKSCCWEKANAGNFRIILLLKKLRLFLPRLGLPKLCYCKPSSHHTEHTTLFERTKHVPQQSIKMLMFTPNAKDNRNLLISLIASASMIPGGRSRTCTILHFYTDSIYVCVCAMKRFPAYSKVILSTDSSIGSVTRTAIRAMFHCTIRTFSLAFKTLNKKNY